jgi:hypothetical protein
MSIEGGLSSGIGAAVATAPSIGAEIGHAASFTPKLSSSGGSFSPGLNASIFSETASFAGSLGSVREGPIGKSGNIFSSSEWTTLGTAKAPVLSAATKADPMLSLGFEPVIARSTTIAEKAVAFNESEWRTLAKATPRSIAETVFPETKPFISENSTFSKVVADKDITILVDSTYKSTQTEEAVIAKVAAGDKEQSKKVVDLMIEAGLYTREEAARRVARILAKKALAKTEEEKESETEVESKTKPAVKPKSMWEQVIPLETEVEEEGAKNKDKKAVKEPPLKVAPVVDEKAQASRKKEVKDKIFNLFNRARWFGWEKINSGEITKDLDKNRANRSLLLSQLWYPLLPDGSLDEIAKTVESAGELRNVSEIAQQDMEKWAEAVINKNTAVKLAEGKAPQVSNKDVKRVLKYIQPVSLVG